MRFQDDATLTPRGGTSRQEESSDLGPDGTVSFTAEAQTSALLSSSNPSPRMHMQSPSIPDGLAGVAPSCASDLASTSHLLRVPSPAPHNFASDGSLLGQYVSDANNPATSTGAQTASAESSELAKQHPTGTNRSAMHSKKLRVMPHAPKANAADCATDASESPLAQPGGPTLLHSNVCTGVSQAPLTVALHPFASLF